MFYCAFYFFKNCFMCGKFIAWKKKKTSWKYHYDNNHELEPVGLLKNGALQVLSSWQNQTVLQCLKIESFGEASSKKTCFSLYLEKGKLFIQLFWPLGFTMVAKKNYIKGINFREFPEFWTISRKFLPRKI